tara:strand:- start:17 stop:736 length:720 start_codon:yes stop_codon:yes gene_type:complete
LEINYVLKIILPILIVELLAAVAGTYYLITTTHWIKSTKYFVIFLWYTFFVELIGTYSPIAYFSNYFSFVEGTSFENNYWWYNIYTLISVSFLSWYFISFVKNAIWKRIAAILIFGFIISGVIEYATSGEFFLMTSSFTSISGAFLLFISIAIFYFELLKSDMLLRLQKFLPFYFSIAVLVFHLTVTPLETLTQYFKLEDGNDLFVKLRANVLMYAILFMYLTFTLGFLICSKKKKSFY